MDTFINTYEIDELIDLLIRADTYISSEYCSRHDEKIIQEICNDTHRLIGDIVLDGLIKGLL